MNRSHPRLSKFIRQLHRRLILLRVAESTAIGLLVGCAAGGVLLGLMFWQGEVTLAPVAGALGIGALCGFFWGCGQRPTPLHAALAADRQLALSDLLATAWSLNAGAGDRSAAHPDPWEATVLALADARCAAISPSGVVLRRLGARAWGGVAVAAAFVMTLAALSGKAPEARAAAENRDASRPRIARLPEVVPPEQFSSTELFPTGRRPHSDPQDDDPQGGPAPSTQANDADPSAPDAFNPDAPDTPSGGADDTGGGTAASPNPGSAQDAPDPASASTAATTPPGTHAAGGVGNATDRAASTGPSGQSTGPSAGAVSAAPWRSAAWPQAIEAAERALQAGHIPHAYADLVRGYFTAAQDR